MSADRDTDRILEAWLQPGPSGMSRDQIAAILWHVDRTRQRRSLFGLRGIAGERHTGLPVALGLVAMIVLVVSAAWIVAGQRGSTSVAAPPTAAPVIPEIGVTISNVEFDRADLYVPASTPFTVRLTIDEAIPHGFQVLGPGGEVAFESQVFEGPTVAEFAVPALAAGQYSFLDPVHPNMSGTLHVGEPAPSPGAVAPSPRSDEPSGSPVPTVEPADAGTAAGVGAPVVDIRAAGLAFGPASVGAPATVPFTIRFRNGDATVPHGITLTDANGTEVFQGQLVIGPVTTTYAAPALAAGTYRLSCVVHPSMTGTLVVGGATTVATEPPVATATLAAPIQPLVTITTDGVRFDPAVTTIGAGPFQVVLVNDAPAAKHGVEIIDAAGNVTASIGPIDGGGRLSTVLDGLPGGTYSLVDPANRTVTATLVVEP